MISLDTVSFTHWNAPTPLFTNFSLKFLSSGLSVLCGSSGSGKTSLLEMLAGKNSLDSGNLLFQDSSNTYNSILRKYKNVELVSQQYDLQKYSTVAENIGKCISNTKADKKRELILDYLRIVGMEDFIDTKVDTLSGGEKQRIAIASCLAKEPKIILLDEPFSGLDPSRRWELQAYLFEFCKNLGIKLILSTHDLQYSMGYADEIIIIKKGEVLHQGKPSSIYTKVNDPYTAGFYGEFSSVTIPFQEYYQIRDSILFPSQITITSIGNFEDKPIQKIPVRVENSKFWGTYYRNMVSVIDFPEQKLILHGKALEIGSLMQVSILSRA